MTMAKIDPKKERYERATEKVNKITNDFGLAALRVECREIDPLDKDDLRLMERVIEDLTETAQNLNYKKKGCLGLAANQLGYNVRIFVIRMKSGKYRPYVNPVILNGTKLESGLEGCLSVPDKQYSMKRQKEINVRSSNRLVHLLRGDESKAYQHELDHLNGKVIGD